ncbi:partial Teichoic acids export ATP-binding protein TagH, partial [Planctomycetaceae bacterium]
MSAVSFKQVSKRFSRQSRAKTLADAVLGWPKRLFSPRGKDGLREHEFWALRDVSFEVEPGDMLGIIGPNGSGKSTILKLLFRILRPDSGEVATQGRVGGLIELGAGFHPYLTGRENVSINGAILGMTRAEIRQRYSSIVEFAGIPEFMDMPVKNYSSGMYARLAFAIAAHANPDVLLVDEVLAVGDASFQLRCYDWMAKQRKQGKTAVCVSHDMYAMAASTRCLWLDGGHVKAQGDPRGVIDAYLEQQKSVGSISAGETSFVPISTGEPRAEITRVEFLSPDGRTLDALDYDATLVLRFHYMIREAVISPIFALSLFHDDARYPVQIPRHYLFHVYSGDCLRGQTVQGAGSIEVEVSQLRLPAGNYRAKVYVMEESGVNPLFVRDGISRIEAKRPEFSDG